VTTIDSQAELVNIHNVEISGMTRGPANAIDTVNMYSESCCEPRVAALEFPCCGRILVADDDPILREYVSAVLTHHGFTVDAVEDGVAAWQALQIGHYDALVTDNLMPRLTGIGLVEKLRSAGMTLPVIMASGCLPDLAEYQWLHSVVALAKPFDPGQLLDLVNQVL
jgi:CheY-like chemotaxis protein